MSKDKGVRWPDGQWFESLSKNPDAKNISRKSITVVPEELSLIKLKMKWSCGQKLLRIYLKFIAAST